MAAAITAATGSADVRDKSISVKGEANKLAVAKAFAGVGTEVKTDGASLLAVILSRLTEVTLDHPAESMIPGEEVLDALDGVSEPAENPTPAASFLYEAEATPPLSAPDQTPLLLYHAQGKLYYEPIRHGLRLAVSDSPGLLSRDDFSPVYGPDGTTVIGFTMSKDIPIPFTVPT